MLELLKLSDASGLCTHYAVDPDAVFSGAAIVSRHPGLLNSHVEFVPAGEIGKLKLHRFETVRKLIVFDAGGKLVRRDHHSRDDVESSFRILARETGLSTAELEQLLSYIDANDSKGTNFKLKMGELNVDQLLVTSIIRGSSQVLHSPLSPLAFDPATSSAYKKEQQRAYWHLVKVANLVINRIATIGNKDFKPTPKARFFLQCSLLQAIAEHNHKKIRFDGWEKTINLLSKKIYPDGDFGIDEDPAYSCFLQMMSQYPPRLTVFQGQDLVTDPKLLNFVFNVTIFGVAEQLVVDEGYQDYQKLEILKECWRALIARYNDWLTAVRHIDIGNEESTRRNVGDYHAITVVSDCAQVGPASRFYRPSDSRHATQTGNPKKANVTIIMRSTGHVQITCMHKEVLKVKMKKAGIMLRILEAHKRNRTIKQAEFRAMELLVENWYISDFGGLFNGSLTNPVVKPTILSLQEINEVVCFMLDLRTEEMDHLVLKAFNQPQCFADEIKRRLEALKSTNNN